MNGYSKELQLDRINNNESYSPNNCRWVTRKQNMRNRRNSIIINNKPLIEIAIEMNIKYSTLKTRYKKYGYVEKPCNICKECGNLFETYRDSQNFCSKLCRDRYYDKYQRR